ncbi:hypothetical protein [Paenibacillus lemnae]|nr:hypothetical protein [Paenibacillus lemnae]
MRHILKAAAAVKYIQQHSKPLTEIAEELNIPINTLRQRVAK